MVAKTKTVDEIRAAIDDAIDRLWAEGMCFGVAPERNPNWVGHGIIEGLKRARGLTGEAWSPRSAPGRPSRPF